MPTDVQYALMAANAYAVKQNVISTNNAVPIPAGFSLFDQRRIDQTGFTARAYKSTAPGSNEIVIAYTGTTGETDGASDWSNGNIPGALGSSAAEQLIDAAKFYLDIRKQNQGAAIKLTGHSLGGGLASLVSVFFNEQAVTFDEAPFGNSAISEVVVNGLKADLARAGYTASAGYDLSAFANYDAASSLSLRQANVRLIYLKDEALSLLQDGASKLVLATVGGIVWPPLGLIAALPTPNIKGSETIIDAKATNGNGWGVPLLLNGQPVDLHDMVLLAGFLQSPDGFLKASQNNPEVLQRIFTSKLTRFDAFGNQQRFLNLMVQQEEQGNASWSAFAIDIARLKGEVGVGDLKAALVGLDIAMHYGQGMDRADGVASGAFQSVINEVTGGIQFAPKAEHAQWSNDSLVEFRKVLSALFIDIGDAAQHISVVADRYTLPTQGALVAPEIADNKTDLMLGSNEADDLRGGGGNDTLIGRGGNDTLNGGSGEDTYLINSGDGADQIIDSGINRIRFNGKPVVGAFVKDIDGKFKDLDSGTGYTIAINSPAVLQLDAGTTLTFANDTSAEAFNAEGYGLRLVDTLAAIETTRSIVGDLLPIDLDPDHQHSDGQVHDWTDDLGNVNVTHVPAPGRGDTLYGSAGNDLIQGKGGDDWIDARGGADRIEGDAGRDILNGGDGKDLLLGGIEADLLHGGSGDDRLFADLEIQLGAVDSQPDGSGRELLAGGEGNDLAVGAATSDALFGGAGNDLLLGGAGDDDLLGDRDVAGNGRDWTLTREIISGAGIIQYKHSYGGDFTSSGEAAAGADILYGGAGNDWLFGGGGNDVLDGGGDDDTLNGLGGNDTAVNQGLWRLRA